MSEAVRTVTPGPFGRAALELCQHGLAVIPVAGAGGKVPQVKWAHWRERPGRDFVSRLMDRHAGNNLGVLCQLSDVTVVDIDEPALTDR